MRHEFVVKGFDNPVAEERKTNRAAQPLTVQPFSKVSWSALPQKKGVEQSG
jgi:hypothetical protein